MPIHYLRGLSSPERVPAANLQLGFSLCLIAGAVNAGGFLAVGQYTSHMTGMVSQWADQLVLGQGRLAMAALLAVLAFLAGAMGTAVLVNWARRRQLRSQFAVCLLAEAGLLLLFGLLDGVLPGRLNGLHLPTTLLLCFIMGWQNAIITKLSRAEIRTTHLTGMLTDIGIELGKLCYPTRAGDPEPVRANLDRLRVLCLLVGGFALGALGGALAFVRVGALAVLPLALWLAVLAAVPLWDDLAAGWQGWLARRHDRQF